MVGVQLMSQDSNNRPLALQPPDTRFQIRPIQYEDVEALRADCWSHRTLTRSRDLIRRIKDAENHQRGLGIVVLGANDTNTIIGYGQVMYWTNCAEISDLMVSEKHRSNGIGTAIIQYLIHNIPLAHLDCIEIGVAKSNDRAMTLYRRLGFVESYKLELNIGGDEKEPVIYLRIMLKDGD
jgi:ribosomal protein S18 acetylase RimI-like enzyme